MRDHRVNQTRRYGLYYPYFHVRDDRWLKVAALYWPRIIRLTPQDYATRDSETVKRFESELHLIQRQPPGPSVAAVAPMFHAIIADRGPELRARYRIDGLGSATLAPGGDVNPRSAVHLGQIDHGLAAALVDAGLARNGRVDLSNEVDRRWLVMCEPLVAIYSSVLAEDFARANKLVPTTDQSDAYAATMNWNTDVIADVLLGDDLDRPQPTSDSSVTGEIVALLALDFLVPANLDRVPAGRIVEIRRRFGPEFLAFGVLVDQIAQDAAALADIRDHQVLLSYLEDDVARRLRQPMADLRRHLRDLKLDTTTIAVNIKTQLPSAAAFAGGPLLAGHPAVAGTAAVALGLIAVRRESQRKREQLTHEALAVSYLLHTHDLLNRQSLAEHSLDIARRISKLGRAPDTAAVSE